MLYYVMIEEYLNRFKKKYLVSSTGCWEWTGWKNHDGYGFFRYLNKKDIQAHRFSAKHLAGLDIDNKVVCHRCDNPGCVNPDHLFTGTQTDNVKDMERKGRRHSNAIQTPLGIFPSQLAAAKAHGVDPTTIVNRLRKQAEDYQRL